MGIIVHFYGGNKTLNTSQDEYRMVALGAGSIVTHFFTPFSLIFISLYSISSWYQILHSLIKAKLCTIIMS